MGFAKELNDAIFITVSLTPSLQRFFNTHVSGASEVNTMLSLDCIDFVSSSVDSHVSTRKTQVSISKTHSNFYRVVFTAICLNLWLFFFLVPSYALLGYAHVHGVLVPSC